MCARYVISSPPDAIRAAFGYLERPNFPPRYNVAPTQPIPIVRLVDGKRHFALVRWGFIPAWATEPKKISLLINARGESLLDKPAFRNAMRRRRCLVPADGFYDWQQGPPKRPYFVRPKGSAGPMAFAGLWETWTGQNGEEVDTATIVTTRANRTLVAVHDRMPAIMAADAFDFWLDCAKVEAETAAALLAPAPEALLECYEVSSAVNRVANDDACLIEPAREPRHDQSGKATDDPLAGHGKKRGTEKNKDDDQLTLF